MTFVMGERSEGIGSDFDGRLRRCVIVESERTPPASGVEVTVEPPLPGDPQLDHVFVVPRHYEALDFTVARHMSVYVLSVDDATRVLYWADVAAEAEDLPPAQEELFRASVASLRDQLEKHGAQLWQSPELGGEELATFVENVQGQYRRGELPEWQTRELELLPRWKWQPHSNVELLRGYAEREGHTDVPRDHVEAGVRLGLWVWAIREFEPPGDSLRDTLESVPGWIWSTTSG